MLDLTDIAVVDNHCHPLLLRQRMNLHEFRRLFTEAGNTDFVDKHVPNAVYYRWMIRQLARFHGCGPTEEEVLDARDSVNIETLFARLVQNAHIDTLVLDLGYPPPDECYTPERMSEAGGCRTAKILRLEIVMQQLIVAHEDFDEVVDRFASELSDIRGAGYCGLKSVVAYRTGLNIAEWSKDEAVASFTEARAQAAREQQFRIAHKPLLDYLLHVAFRKAAEQQVPIQFHTGYGDSDTDMRLGNPLHLRAVMERRDYQTMPIVLLHESYPYSQLGAYLAAIYPHVYFDLSYTIPFVDRLEMVAFTRQALSVAPVSKLVYSTDGICIPEMYWAGALRARSVIGQVLQEMIDADEIDEQDAYRYASMILHDTASDLYRLR
jgi:hypothetical protein